MRKHFLFFALAAFAILSCGEGDMPCVNCADNYCLYFSQNYDPISLSYSSWFKCEYMNASACDEHDGEVYGSDNTCGGALGYCFYNGDCEYTDFCIKKGGTDYGLDNTCGEAPGYSYCLRPNGNCQYAGDSFCSSEGGTNYGSDATCGGGPSSSSRLGSSSSSRLGSSSSVTGGSSSSSSRPSSSSSITGSSSSRGSSSSSAAIIYGTPITYGGETYQTVVIGSQTWMARNLSFNAEGSSCYEGGKVVDTRFEPPITTTLSNAEIQANCAKYGRFYNWSTAMALSSSCNTSSCASQINAKHRGICPTGWHIPSNADWDALMKTVNPSCSGGTYYHCAGAGTKLKASSGWNDRSNGTTGNGTDTYGFAALPGGGLYLDDGDVFYEMVGSFAVWWSSTELSNERAEELRMLSSAEYVESEDGRKGWSASVRCLKD